MKIIDVEQGTAEWLNWRKTVITATDCPAIMGSSPYQTEYECWQRKLGLIEEQKPNEFMERGKRLEPYARDSFIREYGINMTPIVAESSDYEFIGASLDGISDCEKYIIEIKCGGKNLHERAKNGIIPDHYTHQMQHQLLVTGAEKCFYYSFDGEQGKCLELFPDFDFQDKFIKKARQFWKNIAFHESPESDYVNMEESSAWYSYSQEYKEINSQIKILEEKREELRKQIISICEDKNCFGNNLKVMKMMIKGRIYYEDIPELKEVDLEKYRKSPIFSWKIMNEKN